jgi:hypothetical protein
MSRRSNLNKPNYFRQPQRVFVEQIFIPPGPKIIASLYPVRVLVGWLKEPDDIGYLGGEHRLRLTAEDVRQYRQLIRNGNQARSVLPKLIQSDVVRTLPSDYQRHAVQWRGIPFAQPYIAEGWEIALVHLASIISLQPLVSVKKCNSMMSAIHPTDFDSLAELVLPLTGGESYLQVGKVGDRYVMRNGYHRAHTLLRSGVTLVPALVREVHDLAELTLPPGTFAPRIFRLDRPPILSDFLHARLAATIN